MNGHDLMVVGIGASADELDALRGFFENIPADSGMAFVLTLHPPASRPARLAEMLSHWTTMHVIEAADDEVIEPNRLYVPQAQAIATLQGRRLRLRPTGSDIKHDVRPIDVLFDSLAANCGDLAVGIVMSGTGSDGALGLKAIRERGGLTLVQSDGSASFRTDGLVSYPRPESSPGRTITAGAADHVAPIMMMPSLLLRMQHRRYRNQSLTDFAALAQTARLEICKVLKSRLGHDFTGYREKPFLRRVRRRMKILNITTLADYIARLNNDHDEASLLFHDLLIRTTGFFRDPATFALLTQQVVPLLFAGKRAGDQVRVWVAGCATGEEAYSLAIVLREQLDGMSEPPTVQIFATDIDTNAIATARAGRYPAKLCDGLAPVRRNRFFTEAEGEIMVAPEIRALCTFAPHSILQDPPYARMDLVSCRNLLIYLDPRVQAQIIPVLHYSLVPGGILLLGHTETPAPHEALFTSVGNSSHIFVRRERHPFPRPVPPGASRSVARIRPTGAGMAAHQALSGAARRVAFDAREALRFGLYAGLRRLRLVPQNLDVPVRDAPATDYPQQRPTTEYDTAVEALRGVNQELQAINEELETSKEELQAVNDQLHAVNTQLSEKIDELYRINSDLRTLLDSTDVGIILLNADLIISGFSPAAAAVYNLISRDQGRKLTDIVNRLTYDRLPEDVREVLDTLRPLERQVTRDDLEAHYLLRILPYRGNGSVVTGALMIFIDITSFFQAGAQQRQIIGELNDRVSHMLTGLTPIATQNPQRSSGLATFSSAFLGRVARLNASYSLLSKADADDASLRDIVIAETRPFLSTERRNILVEGPPVRLAPRAALAMGLAIHELADNAVKFGALSVPDGTVTIGWSVEEAAGVRELVLRWRESGGPPVAPPSDRGFGLTLIEGGLVNELRGGTMMAFPPSGLQASLRARLA